MVCSKCGTEVPEGRKFCVKCGTAFSGEAEPRDMAQRNANCAKCDAPLAPGRAFCGSCGNRVIPSSGGGTSSESLERVGPISSTQKKLNDATEKGELTDPAMVSVLNSADGQRTTAKNNDALAVLGRYEEVENRSRASNWIWVAIAVATLVSVGGWFMLHRTKQQVPPQVAPQSSSTTASTPTATAPVTVTAGLTTRTLANMDYEVGDALSELGERTSTVTLVDGKGSFGDWNAFLDKDHIAFGDLDGDGIDDAVVVLTFEGPGSAAPQVLVAVTNLHGKGESTASKGLGYSAIIKKISISGGIITVNTLTVGPNDSMANPETPEVLRLKVKGGKFLPAD
jgi:Double zinc ribbon